MIQLTNPKDCRIVTPFICVLVGSILTIVGFAASLEIVKMVGPVVMIIGGLMFIIIPVSCKRIRSSEDTSCEGHSNSYEQNGAPSSDEGSICQQGSIHQVELSIPPELLVGPEIVPPSYEESVNNNSTVVNFQDTQEFRPHCDKTSSEPQSDKERRDDA